MKKPVFSFSFALRHQLYCKTAQHSITRQYLSALSCLIGLCLYIYIIYISSLCLVYAVHYIYTPLTEHIKTLLQFSISYILLLRFLSEYHPFRISIYILLFFFILFLILFFFQRCTRHVYYICVLLYTVREQLIIYAVRARVYTFRRAYGLPTTNDEAARCCSHIIAILITKQKASFLLLSYSFYK